LDIQTDANSFVIKFICIGELLASDQQILVNWYNSLTSTGNLDWDIQNDLCGQYGINCSDPSPQRVTTLYSLFHFFIHF